jgi:hypothetical protein
MKKILIIFLFILINNHLYSQIQSVSLAGGTTPHRIDIPQGRVLEVIDFKTAEGSIWGTLTLNGNILLSERVFAYSSPYATPYTTRVLVKLIPGPAYLEVSPNQAATYFSYKIYDNSSVATQLPSNSAVVSSNTNGNVRVVLESSVDMVNWTNASPGNYGASRTKRFFRIRVVNQ